MNIKYFIIHQFGSGMHYIMIPPSIVSTFEEERRVVCTIRNITFHCAFMPKKEGGYYINLGSRLMKELHLAKDQIISPIFSKDTTTYQFQMPEEFEEVLRTDGEAYKIFQSLTVGNQRSIIYLVNQPASTNKKIERALVVCRKLKLGITAARMMLKK
jgi:hypothetical protein